jgi:hypothetical protein
MTGVHHSITKFVCLEETFYSAEEPYILPGKKYLRAI